MSLRTYSSPSSAGELTASVGARLLVSGEDDFRGSAADSRRPRPRRERRSSKLRDGEVAMTSEIEAGKRGAGALNVWKGYGTGGSTRAQTRNQGCEPAQTFVRTIAPLTPRSSAIG